MNATCPVDLVAETNTCVCLRKSADDEVNRSIKRSNEILEQGDLIVGESIGMERIQTIHICVNVVRAIYDNPIFTEKFLWSLQSLFLNRFYTDCCVFF